MKKVKNYFKNKQWAVWQINLMVSFGFVLLFNQLFWQEIGTLLELNSLADVWFLVSIFLLVVTVINLVLNVLVSKTSRLYVYGFLLFITCICFYYMMQYNIVIDRDMIRNVMETNASEAKDLLSFNLLFYFLLLFVLPVWLIAKLQVKQLSFMGLCLEKTIVMLVSLPVMGGLIYFSYPSYASLARENHQLSHMILPTNFIFASLSYVNEQISNHSEVFEEITSDTVMKQDLSAGKKVTIIIVGETARADRFGLNQYSRNTNPKLSQRKLINFQHTTSCGTSTATSLPCLFSYLERNKYNHRLGKNSSNLLDFYKSVGFDVQWRDNNTGCKGLCDRVEFVDMTHLEDNPLCQTGECFDEVLLSGLKEQIISNNNNQLIVLHQKGSHGPAYHLRYPKDFEVFKPTCKEVQLQKCSREALNNSYDNTILYTDYVIDATIALLESLPEDTESSLVYVSDHGESLGENNLYLHGTPYLIAPESQKHVPFLFWASNQYQQHTHINQACLERKQSLGVSHDNFFHSMLGLVNINSSYYQANLDVFASCQPSDVSVLVASEHPINGS